MKKVSQASVAELAGVSITTVSRVVNNSGYVAENVRKQVNDAISELGYICPAKREYISENLLGLISLKVPANFYFDKLGLAINDEAENTGYNIVTTHAPCINNATLRRYVENLLSMGICGLIICGFNDDNLDADLRNFLISCEIPIVFVERTVGSYGFNQVFIDNKVGTFYATKHLIDKGHTHLLYIARERATSVETSRLEGFRSAIAEAKNNNLASSIQYCTDQLVHNGYDAMKNALIDDPEITGVIVWFDGYAAGAMQYLYETERRIPDDIEIVGHDDTLAYLLSPPISSIHMPFEEMASSTMGIIKMARESDSKTIKKTISLEPRLVIR